MPLDSNSKSGRILELYQMFLMGKVINKQEMADYYGVNARSIQRDIETIRDFLADQVTQQGVVRGIEYDGKAKGYKLVAQEVNLFSEGEMLAICKILIESKAFSKVEMTSLLNRLLNLAFSQKDKEQIEWYISNELFHYSDPAHPSVNTQHLWDIALAVKEHKVIELTYGRLKNKSVITRKIEPVGILFSEYYFYLMGVIRDPAKRESFDKKNDPFPTIYRIDRIKKIDILDERFTVTYNNRFQEGEYKNRVQFMYGGEPQKVEFKFYGQSIEAVKDRLPLSEVIEEADGSYRIKAETFGTGILIWLLSQGSKVEVIGPEDLKISWLNESIQILQREGKKL